METTLEMPCFQTESFKHLIAGDLEGVLREQEVSPAPHGFMEDAINLNRSSAIRSSHTRTAPLYKVPAAVLDHYYGDLLHPQEGTDKGRSSNLPKPTQRQSDALSSSCFVKRSCVTKPKERSIPTGPFRDRVLPILKTSYKVNKMRQERAERASPPLSLHHTISGCPGGYEEFSDALDKFMRTIECQDLGAAWSKLTKWIGQFHLDAKRDAIEETLAELVKKIPLYVENPLRHSLVFTILDQMLQLLVLEHPLLAQHIETLHKEILAYSFVNYQQEGAEVDTAATTVRIATLKDQQSEQTLRDAIKRRADSKMQVQRKGVATSLHCNSLVNLQDFYRTFKPYYEALDEAQKDFRSKVNDIVYIEECTGKRMQIGERTVSYWKRHLKRRILRAWRLLCTNRRQMQEQKKEKEQVKELQQEVKRLRSDLREEARKKTEEVTQLKERIASFESEMATAERLVTSLKDRLAATKK